MTKARDLASGGFGLVLIKPSTVVNGTDNGKGTVTFSGSSSVSLNGVFSSTYDHYVIMTSTSGSTTTQALKIRMRAAGSDNSSANYYGKQYGGNSDQANITTNDINGATSMDMGAATTGNQNTAEISVRNPFSNSIRTTIYAGVPFSDGTNGRVYTYGVALSVTTSYDGFTIFPASGTITGTISVYGYNK